MPLDFLSVKQQIRTLAAEAPGQLRHLDIRRRRAAELLSAYSDKGTDLRTKVEKVAPERSAKPTDEPLTASFPLPAIEHLVTVIAADGSQITADRHAAVRYFLINIGAITLIPGSGEVPVIHVESDLSYAEYTEEGAFTSEEVGQLRDTAERTVLSKLVPRAKLKPVITLTDGPLELWGGFNRDPDQQVGFLRNLSEYIAALREIEQLGAIAAGYEDKSLRGLVVRALEIALTPTDQLAGIKKQRPLRGVLDRDLFATLLPSGARSALFEIQHQLANYYSDSLSLHFFYLNVGEEGEPSLAQVEIPGWVAKDKSLVNILHATLVQQCKSTPSAPFPYALHRADEIARVTFAEKDEVTNQLITELAKHGIEVGKVSNKQALKNVGYRGR